MGELESKVVGKDEIRNPQFEIRKSSSAEIRFNNVSKFYGEILGVNRV